MNWLLSVVSPKIMAVAAMLFLAVIGALSTQVWWLQGQLEDAIAEREQFKSAYNLLAAKTVAQNAFINELGERQKRAEEAYADAVEQNAGLKERNNALLDQLKRHRYDPKKSACVNAMDLILKAKEAE